jgi:hypothetical protein
LLCALLVGGECTLKSSLFDEPAPTLLPAVLAGDGLAGGKRAVTCPVSQSPLPRLQLQLPASASPMECSAGSAAALLRLAGLA